jgi:hypothetical protein
MAVWEVSLLCESIIEDVKTLEIEAPSKDAALYAAQDKCPDDYTILSAKKKLSSHGGARPGAGQPSKFGEKTKVVRLPESIANDVEGFVQKYQDLKFNLQTSKQELEPRKNLVRAKEAYDLVLELLFILES